MVKFNLSFILFFINIAGLSDLRGCGEKHTECGASGIPAAASSQSLSCGVWRAQVSTSNHLIPNQQQQACCEEDS